MRIDSSAYNAHRNKTSKTPHYVFEVSGNKANSDLAYFGDEDAAFPDNAISSDDDFVVSQIQGIEINTAQTTGDYFGGALSFTHDASLMLITAPKYEGSTDHALGVCELHTWNAITAQYDFAQTITVAGKTAAEHYALHAKISGDGSTIAINAIDDADTVTGGGAIYLFRKISDVWTQVARIEPTGVAAGDNFGWRFDLSYSGNVLLGTAPFEGTNRGEAYIFEELTANWATYAETVLVPSTRTNNYRFGYDCALSGNGKIAFISHYDSANTGTVNYFIKQVDVWPATQTGSFQASDAQAGDYYGCGRSVEPDDYSTAALATNYTGDIVVAGSYTWTEPGSKAIGAAYYNRWSEQRGGFVQLQRIQPPLNIVDPADDDYRFGNCLALTTDGHRLVVGAQSMNTSASVPYSGYNFLYDLSSTGYLLASQIQNDSPLTLTFEAYAVGISGNGRILGSGASNWDGTNLYGKAFIYDASAMVAYPGTIKERTGISSSSQSYDPIKALSSIGNINLTLVDSDMKVSAYLNARWNRGYGMTGQRVRVYSGYDDMEFSQYTVVATQNIRRITQDGGVVKFFLEDPQRFIKESIFEQKKTNLISNISESGITVSVRNTLDFETVMHSGSYSDAPNARVGYIELDEEVLRWTGKSVTGTGGTFTIDNAATTLSSSLAKDANEVLVTSTTDFRSNGMGYITDGVTISTIHWTGKSASPHKLTGVSGVDVAYDNLDDIVDAKGRGVLGTRPAIHEIDDDVSTSDDRQPVVTEHIYMEMPAVKCLLALMGQGLYGQPGEDIPDHWRVNVDSQYIATSTFLDIGQDIWDYTLDDDDVNIGKMVYFDGLTKADAKSFVNEQIDILTACFMFVRTDGQLGYKRTQGAQRSAAYVGVLNKNNILSATQVTHDVDKMYNAFGINYNWSNTENRLNRSERFEDYHSQTKNNLRREINFNLRGLHGSRDTRSTISRIVESLRSWCAHPPVALSVTAKDTHNMYEVGDILRVEDIEIIRDFTSDSLEIDRSLAVKSVTMDWIKARPTFHLVGATEKAYPLDTTVEGGGVQSTAGTVMNDSWYSSEGVPIAQVLSTTLTSGVRHLDTPGTLVGNADMTKDFSTTLSGALAAGVTTVNVVSTTGSDDEGTILIESEYITYTAKTSTSYTGCTRGEYDTTDVLHPDTTAVHQTAIYYIEEDTNLEEVVTWTDNVCLKIKGHLDNTAGMTSKGMGIPGKTSTACVIGDDVNYPTEGFIGVTKSQASLSPIKEGYTITGANSQFPEHSIINDNGNGILNLFSDLRGAPGAEGAKLEDIVGPNERPPPTRTQCQPGGDGGAGGGAIRLVCRGYSRSGSGYIDTSGADGSPLAGVSGSYMPSWLWGGGIDTIHAASGAPGYAGAAELLLDGDNANETDFAASIIAYTGNSPITGNVVSQDVLEPYIKTVDVNGTPTVGTDLTAFADPGVYALDNGGFIRPRGGGPLYPYAPAVHHDIGTQIHEVADSVYSIKRIPSYIAPTIDVETTSTVASAINVAVVDATKATVNQTSLELSVTPPTDGNYAYSNIYIRQDGYGDSWELVGAAAGTNEVVYRNAIPGITYNIKAHPVAKVLNTGAAPSNRTWFGVSPKVQASYTNIESPEFIYRSYDLSGTLAAVVGTNQSLRSSPTAGDGSASSAGWIIRNGAIETFPANSSTPQVTIDNNGELYAGDSAEDFIKYTASAGAEAGRAASLIGTNTINEDGIFFHIPVWIASHLEFPFVVFTASADDVVELGIGAAGAVSMESGSTAGDYSSLILSVDPDLSLQTKSWANTRILKLQLVNVPGVADRQVLLMCGDSAIGASNAGIGVWYDLSTTTWKALSHSGGSSTSTALSSGITDADSILILFDPGTDVKFYINGNLEATITTNLPSGSLSIYRVFTFRIQSDNNTSATTPMVIGELKYLEYQQGT